jgi:hypothetical protein
VPDSPDVPLNPLMPLPEKPLTPDGPCNGPIFDQVSSPFDNAPSPALYPPPDSCTM